MARGKLKYRDVVGGRTKNRKSFHNKKGKQRKSFSLHQQHNKSNKKRKQSFNENYDLLKKQKTESFKEKETELTEEEESESEDDLDQMQQLRSTFTSFKTNKIVEAIESSDETASEEEENMKEKNEKSDIENDSDKDTLNEGKVKLQPTEENPNESLDSQIKQDEVEIVNKEEEYKDNDDDPFVKHVCYDLHKSVLDSLQSVPVAMEEHVLNWPVLGRLIVQIPVYKELEENVNTFCIDKQKKFAPSGSVPIKIKSSDLETPESLFIKTQIKNNLSKANTCCKDGEILTEFQTELFSVINNYQDLYFSERNFNNAEAIRFVYCLHSVNHILKTRLKVIHHNARISDKDEVPEEFRDQGLVRPKILMVVPFKDSAYRIVQMLMNILLPDDKGHVMNKKRFLEEYTGNEISLPKRNPKPEDYELTFSGNTSDDFKIGITVTKKSLKLYADFYSSDIIIASPLGLRTIIGAEGEAERDYDFLASLELLILDQTELFYMQNWDHLMHVFNHLHLQPKDSHGTDFSRVRTWSLNGWAKFYRQTLMFSSILLPEINAIFNKKCYNHFGKVKVSNPIEFGSIRQVFVQIPHVFHKFQAANAQQSIEARFEFFINKILPQQKDSLMKQTLIFVSNYFDFVRLRNYFKKEEISFVQICEYSKEGKVARARDLFFHGDAHFLLYTERFHFFNRIRVKGIRHLVFYEPPAFPHFYYELCNLMQETNMNRKIGSMTNMSVNLLYSKYDIHRIAAIVGTERTTKILHSDRTVHMMVTGSD